MSVFFTLVNFGFSIWEVTRLDDLKHFIEDEVKQLDELKLSELDDFFADVAKEKKQVPFTVARLIDEKQIDFEEKQPIIRQKTLGASTYSGQINSLGLPHGLGVI